VLISQLFGEQKVNKTKRDSRSGLLIGLTASALVPFGGASGSQAEISSEAMAQEIITILAQPQNQERIRKILIDGGLDSSKVRSLVSALSSASCRKVVAAEGGSGSGKNAIKQAAENLLVYAQRERLEVIYRKVRSLPEDQIARVGGASESKDVELEFDIKSGFFKRLFGITGIVGLDRTIIYESFIQTVKADGDSQHSILRDGTRLAIEGATYKRSSRQQGILELRVNASFRGSKGEIVSISLPVRLTENTPEQVVVVALMTIASSPHFLANLSFLRSEINALIFAANKMKSLLIFDSRFRMDTKNRRNLGILQHVLKNLESAKGSADRILSVVIDSKILLGNLMNDQMLALQSSGLNMKVILRTDPTTSPTNQSPQRVKVAVPARVVQTPSSGRSDSIDPYFAYYYPWISYPGVSHGNFYPWWVLEELTSYSYHGGAGGQSLEAEGRSFNGDFERGLGHSNFVDHPPSIETYTGPDGSVVVLDSLSRDSSLPQAETLREDGFQLQESVPQDLSGLGSQTDDGLWNAGDKPVFDDNSLRGDESLTGRDGDRDHGVTVIVTTGESTVITTTGDYTTTTTTTTGDYTTTTTGDYTTTTTGDY
jgi:hypothetical protein